MSRLGFQHATFRLWGERFNRLRHRLGHNVMIIIHDVMIILLNDMMIVHNVTIVLQFVIMVLYRGRMGENDCADTCYQRVNHTQLSVSPGKTIPPDKKALTCFLKKNSRAHPST